VNKLSIKQNDPIKPENERQEYRNALAKQTFQSKKLEKYSNKLLVTNLPENVTAKDLQTLFPHHQKIDLKHQAPNPKAIITYSSAKEAMDMRMSVRPILNGQKFRVIILLLNSDSKR
jgi:RNA recognition motif-containing protein